MKSLAYFIIKLMYLITNFVMIKSTKSIDNQYFLGIDFGSEFIKASVFSTTTGKSIMVENLESKTNSINLFMLDNEKIYYGQEAYFKQMKYPKSSFTYINDFINSYQYNEENRKVEKVGSNNGLKCLNKRIVENFLFTGLFDKNDYICNDSGDIVFDIKFGKNNYKLSLQAILSIQINFILDLAINTMKKEISNEEYFLNLFKNSNKTSYNEILEAEYVKRFKGVVFAYSDGLNYHRSTIIREAFEIVNKIKFSKLLGIITNLDSISYYYATEFLIYNNENKNVNVSFIDIGSSKTKLGYYNFEVDRNTNHISIKHLKSMSSNFAGRTIDNALFKIYDKNENYTLNHKFRSYPYIQKYKEVLSANKITDYNILSITGKFEREDLYSKLNEDLTSFEEFLKNSSINIKLDSIELLGGSTRVPIVKEIIEKILKNEDHSESDSYKKIVGSRINGDDSSVLAASKLGFYLNLKNIGENKFGRTHLKLNSLKDNRYFVDLFTLKFSDSDSEVNFESGLEFDKNSIRKKLLGNYTIYDYDFNSRNSNLKLSLDFNNVDLLEVSLYESNKNIDNKESTTEKVNIISDNKANLIKTFKIIELNNFSNEIANYNCTSMVVEINFHFTHTNQLLINSAVAKCEYPIYLSFNISQTFTAFYDSHMLVSG